MYDNPESEVACAKCHTKKKWKYINNPYVSVPLCDWCALAEMLRSYGWKVDPKYSAAEDN
jgi:hypothetical protein